MGIIGGIIGGVASLIGGSKAASDQSRENERSRSYATSSSKRDKRYYRPNKIRRRYQNAGFNPLLGLGGAQHGSTPVSYAPVMVNGIAEAGQSFAHAAEAAIDAKKDKEVQDLQKQNEDLQSELNDARLRPEVPGIYGDRQNGSTVKGDGRGVQAVAGLVPSGDDLGLSGGLVAPGRDLKVDEFTSSPGLFEVNNRGTAGPVVLPGDSEPWGVDELATALVLGAPQVSYNYGKKATQKVVDIYNGAVMYRKARQSAIDETERGKSRADAERERLNRQRQITTGGFFPPTLKSPLKN